MKTVYVIATTERQPRPYTFHSMGEFGFSAHPRRTLRGATAFSSKDLAKKAAISAGLKTWQYVKLNQLQINSL